jgi:bacterioferritin
MVKAGRMDRIELIERLNEDLMLEYQSIVQYIAHIASVKGAQFQQIGEHLGVHLAQEVEHAKTIARQIDFLGGTPTTDVPAITRTGSPEEALADDLELERTQLERYRERIEQAIELGLPDVAEALAPVLRETQDHFRELRSVLWSPTGIHRPEKPRQVHH